MIRYKSELEGISRRFRSEMTECERLLWSRLSKRQFYAVQFYRQKPIGLHSGFLHTGQPNWP